MRQEVRLAGFGGQGIILAGYIVGKAAALYDGREAILTQAYGPEARGGACSAELVLDDVPIDYAMLNTPSILVLMSQDAYEQFGKHAGPQTTVIVESDLVEGAPAEWPGIPATRLAEELGTRISANTASPRRSFWYGRVYFARRVHSNRFASYLLSVQFSAKSGCG